MQTSPWLGPQSRCFILNSLRPIPAASYQCTSARWTEPSGQPNTRDTLSLAPATASIGSSQAGNLADSGRGGECLDIRDVAQNLEAHRPIVSKPFQPVNLARRSTALARCTYMLQCSSATSISVP